MGSELAAVARRAVMFAVCAGAVPSAAQMPAPVAARRVAPAALGTLVAPPRVVRGGAEAGGSGAAIAPNWAPAASLLVPGSGQGMLRQTRGVAYIAAEVYLLLQYREFARDARARRAEYRRTAREVARRDFGGVSDGPWAYYEAVLDYVASGQYNTTPGGPLTPETDVLTFNGRRWLDARSLYWLDPDVPPPRDDPRYARALEAYTANAVQGEFRWNWRGQQLQWQLYMDAINRENQLTRYMNTTLNAVIANHLLSAIDALTSVRLRQLRGPGGEQRFEATIPWAPFGRPPRERP